MKAWELPTCLEIGGVGYRIRTDFRDVLYVLGQMADPENGAEERTTMCLLLYEDWESIPTERWGEAMTAAGAFLSGGLEDDGRKRPRTVDWEQDAPIIIPAVNKVLGRDVRNMEHLHWWTFLGAYMEIGESLFSTVVNIRQKRARGEKLEKYEQRFCRENRGLVEIRRRYTAAEKAIEREWT